MYINNTQSTLVIGRFYVRPGEKLSPLPKSSSEEEQIKRLLDKKLLVEVIPQKPKPKPVKKVEPQPEPVKKVEPEPQPQPQQEENK